MTSAADEYRARLAARRETHARLTATDARFGYARLTIFAVGVLVAIAAARGWITPWWAVIPIASFGALVVGHDRVIRAIDAAGRAIAYYERGLARIEDRWAGTGEGGERFLDADHLYAHDLDLFGRGSLFELLSTARTRAGENTLAAWMLAPAAPEEIRARQLAVDDLAPRLDLREALSLAGAAVRASVHGDALVAWAESPPLLRRGWIRPVAAVLSVAAFATAAYWGVRADPGPLVTVVMLEILFSLPFRAQTITALHASEGPARDLDVLAVVLAHLENERFDTERLGTLQRQLAHATAPGQAVRASTAIRQLHRLSELHDWQHNMFFAPIAATALWGTHLALAVEAWRRVHGPDVREWLRVSGEFEALASLSAYRYEHPKDPFPEIAASNSREARFEGAGLGHPLIPATRMVRSDVRLDGATPLLVVSGSNMSGKSTLLRTVGVNAVLAFAGAPVRATSLSLTPLRLGATLRIQDSLQEGRSRFYAEITRVRDIANLASGPIPVLFLLDELFHGTNSHDRVAGAAGVLSTLVDRHAIGLVTTHDLAVTRVADDVKPPGVNVHFEDHFEGGEIHFDYLMKPGPVTRSNAIALMRAVGLDIPQS